MGGLKMDFQAEKALLQLLLVQNLALLFSKMKGRAKQMQTLPSLNVFENSLCR
jgi:hypothetical protein